MNAESAWSKPETVAGFVASPPNAALLRMAGEELRRAQCFLTEPQLLSELEAGGFVPDAAHPLRELNRPPPGALTACRAPVIYEGLFRRRRE